VALADRIGDGGRGFVQPHQSPSRTHAGSGQRARAAKECRDGECRDGLEGGICLGATGNRGVLILCVYVVPAESPVHGHPRRYSGI